MKAVKIVLDTVRTPEAGWCWRADWYTGACSTYGLLMKFGMLNAVSAKDIASAFISRKCGIKSKVCARPDVDLRDPKLFDLGIMGETFRMTSSEIQAAFLFELLPRSKVRSSGHLRWCESCLARGFHTPIFQMALLVTCPIHHTALRNFCRHCGQQIPYRLSQEVLANPFCCPGCKADLAPGMRGPRAQVLLPRPQDMYVINQMLELLKIEEEVVQTKMEALGRDDQYGKGEIIFSRPGLDGKMSRYIGFVLQVLEQLKSRASSAQSALSMERLDRAERGAPPSDRSEYNDELLRHPSWANQLISTEDSCGDQTGDPPGESELQTVTLIYRAIRRYLWRHTLRNHRRCIVAASRKLWWRMDEEMTQSFCPVAEAYLRWRMAWEGCGTPRYLFGSKQKTLSGLIGWVSSRPSPCPSHWCRQTQLWIIAHIFGNACIESFRERLSEAIENDRRGKIHWKRSIFPVRYDTYWAVTGSDRRTEPATVYLRAPLPLPPEFHTLRVGRAHVKTHLTHLAAITR